MKKPDGYQQFFKKARELRQDHREEKLRAAFKMKPSRKRRPPLPIKALVGLALSLGIAGFCLSSPHAIVSWLDRWEISAMVGAQAEEKAATKSAPAPANVEKSAAARPPANPDQGLQSKPSVPEDLSHFEKLRERKEELDLREKELAELEEELQRQKVELDKRIVQLEEMRNQIAQVLKERVEVDQEKVTKLVDLYSNMKPKQAADVLANINEDLAVEVLAKMKKKNAAEIMNLLPADKAKVLSEKYTGYRRVHGEPKG